MMKDHYNRTIRYLRLSVTDLCNYRCFYCMPLCGIEKKRHSDILSIEEMTEIVRAAHALGVNKVRLTGGEPLIRKGILTLCENIKRIDDRIELSLTTNGALLKDFALPLKEAGVDRLNVSLDTLDEEKFRTITRLGSLKDVLDGLDAADRAGFENTKINTVLMGTVNTDEIADFARFSEERGYLIRFIELMPMNITKTLPKEYFVSNRVVLDTLPELRKIRDDGVSRVYQTERGGTIGLISPISDRFCDRCDRIRITSNGYLKPCLHSDTEISLKGLSGEELIDAIKSGVMEKPAGHQLDRFSSSTRRDMNEIGG